MVIKFFLPTFLLGQLVNLNSDFGRGIKCGYVVAKTVVTSNLACDSRFPI